MSAVHAPHAHAPVSVNGIMGAVMLALVPATLFGFWLYGWPALYLWLTALAAAALGEALALRLMGRPVWATLRDGSALLTGWLLALTLPPWAPWWIAALGSMFAVVAVKQVFGGLGQNVFNPAMAARVMLLISFPLEMTAWVAPTPLTSPQAPGPLEALSITFAGATLDAVSSASLLGHVKTELGRGVDLSASLPEVYAAQAQLWGQRIGSLGETSALLLMLGGLYLLARGVITWQAPAATLLGVALPAAVAHALDPAHYLGAVPHLLSGGLVLAAFFIVTDPVTSPNTALGQVLFGLGVGLLTWLIRTFGGYPEGLGFAVLLMNAATPVIDRYVRPRIFGRDRRGRALPAEETR